MDEAQFEALTRQIVGAMRNNLEFPWADITIYLVIFGITFFASLLSSRLHSYFSKRAEYAAQVKDLKKLDRVESTITRSTEEIKSYIAGRLWVDQRFWELKREIYWQLCSVLQRLSDSISEILQPDFREARRLAGGQNDLTEPPVRLIRLQHDPT